jgi:hypothetical protein
MLMTVNSEASLLPSDIFICSFIQSSTHCSVNVKLTGYMYTTGSSNNAIYIFLQFQFLCKDRTYQQKVVFFLNEVK